MRPFLEQVGVMSVVILVVVVVQMNSPIGQEAIALSAHKTRKRLSNASSLSSVAIVIHSSVVIVSVAKHWTRLH